jgi:hypothetical protein
VLRSDRVRAVRCRPKIAVVEDAEKLEATGLATYDVVDVPHVAVPARPINANLRRRTDDRLAEEINADLASVAAPAGDQAAGRHPPTPDRGRRRSCCCTMLILARSSQCRGSASRSSSNMATT